jgi:hypothetical protein
MKYILVILFVLCSVQSKIVMIGDSILDSSVTTIHEKLEILAKQSIENYSKSGATITPNLNDKPCIPCQFNASTNISVAEIIIMDGGANDILTISKNPSWLKFPLYRQRIISIESNLNLLFSEMKDLGVGQVIYLGNYYLDGNQAIVDYGTNILMNICKQAPLHVHFVDVRQFTIPLKENDIHPNTVGDEILAQNIWNVLKNITIN